MLNIATVKFERVKCLLRFFDCNIFSMSGVFFLLIMLDKIVTFKKIRLTFFAGNL